MKALRVLTARQDSGYSTTGLPSRRLRHPAIHYHPFGKLSTDPGGSAGNAGQPDRSGTQQEGAIQQLRSEPTRRVVRCMPGRQQPSRRANSALSQPQPERRGVQCELLAESGVRWPGVQAAGAVCTTKRRAGVLPRFFFARVSWLGRMHCSDSACYQSASVKAVRPKRACVGGHFPLWRSCGARTCAGLGCSRVHCAAPPTLLRWCVQRSQGCEKPAMCARSAGTASTSCPC
jgi:hypothetical protein